MTKQDISDTALIIPAFNEYKNLSVLLPDIMKAFPSITVFVIDDSLGHEQISLEKLCSSYTSKIVYICRKSKLGRGSAVIDGLRRAFHMSSNFKYFLEMDADFAHNPEEIPNLIHGLHEADLVIGSRYLSGSAIMNWPKSRLYQSRIINFFLTYWLNLHITDYTNGFRAYSRKAVDSLLSLQLREKGFIALSEIAYKLQKQGFRITEVPISFTDRKYGVSNATLVELLSSLKGVILLRLFS